MSDDRAHKRANAPSERRGRKPSGDDRAGGSRRSHSDQSKRSATGPKGGQGVRGHAKSGSPQRGGERRGAGGSSRQEDRRLDRDARRPDTRRSVPQGLADVVDEPRLPDDFDDKQLPRAVKAELRSLPKDLARTTAGHLMAAIELGEIDPELAHRHAQAAKRRASRLPIVREIAGEAAYAAGEYVAALNEFRAVRRMTGNDEFLPVIADCERAIGHPQEAIALAREAAKLDLSAEQLIEMRIVEAGAREDLGDVSEARRLLKAAMADRRGPRSGHARLRMAYAELLARQGDEEGAETWLLQARRLDPENELHADVRLAQLRGEEPPASPDEADDVDIFEVEA